MPTPLVAISPVRLQPLWSVRLLVPPVKLSASARVKPSPARPPEIAPEVVMASPAPMIPAPPAPCAPDWAVPSPPLPPLPPMIDPGVGDRQARPTDADTAVAAGAACRRRVNEGVAARTAAAALDREAIDETGATDAEGDAAAAAAAAATEVCVNAPAAGTAIAGGSCFPMWATETAEVTLAPKPPAPPPPPTPALLLPPPLPPLPPVSGPMAPDVGTTAPWAPPPPPPPISQSPVCPSSPLPPATAAPAPPAPPTPPGRITVAAIAARCASPTAPAGAKRESTGPRATGAGKRIRAADSSAGPRAAVRQGGAGAYRQACDGETGEPTNCRAAPPPADASARPPPAHAAPPSAPPKLSWPPHCARPQGADSQ